MTLSCEHLVGGGGGWWVSPWKTPAVGFWDKQADGAPERQGTKFPENVLELGEEGSRGLEVQMGQSRSRSLLSLTGVFERSQEGCR